MRCSSACGKLLALGLATALLAGCSEYGNRRDTISPWAGSALSANLAVHRVSAHPTHANNTAIRGDGQAALAAQLRYRGQGLPAEAPAAMPLAKE